MIPFWTKKSGIKKPVSIVTNSNTSKGFLNSDNLPRIIFFPISKKPTILIPKFPNKKIKKASDSS